MPVLVESRNTVVDSLSPGSYFLSQLIPSVNVDSHSWLISVNPLSRDKFSVKQALGDGIIPFAGHVPRSGVIFLALTLGRPARERISLFVIQSLDWISRMCINCQCLNCFRHLVWSGYRVYVSQAYSSVDKTTTIKTMLLVLIVNAWLLTIWLSSHPRRE